MMRNTKRTTTLAKRIWGIFNGRANQCDSRSSAGHRGTICCMAVIGEWDDANEEREELVMTDGHRNMLECAARVCGLTRSEILNHVSYDPETGIFYRTDSSKTNKRFAGKKAGALVKCNNASKTKYVNIFINGKTVKAHRAAWLIFYGEEPLHIDHIDGDGSNNKISNLRSVSHKENHKNMPLQSNSSTGISGVSFDNKRNVFEAYCFNNSKKKSLGRFCNIFEAACARKSWERGMNYHENHGRAITLAAARLGGYDG